MSKVTLLQNLGENLTQEEVDGLLAEGDEGDGLISYTHFCSN